MFTATKGFDCSVCLSAVEQLNKVAVSYRAHIKKTNLKKPKIYFVVIDVSKARDAFVDMSIETIPRIYLFKPGQAFRSAESILIDDPGTIWYSIIQQISRETGHSIVMLKDPMNPRVIRQIIFALTVFAITAFTLHITGVLYSSLFWAIVCSIQATFSISGNIYNRIRGVPFSAKDGQTWIHRWVAQSQRDQYTTECYVISASYLGLIVGIVLMDYGASSDCCDQTNRERKANNECRSLKTKRKFVRTANQKLTSLASKLADWKYLKLIGFILASISCNLITYLFTFKSPFYPYSLF